MYLRGPKSECRAFSPTVTRTSTLTEPPLSTALDSRLHTPDMSSQNSRLGDCPRCGATIHDWHVLVEYETNGRHRYWADCPDCGAVVDPDA